MLQKIDGFLYNTLLRPNLTYLAFCMERYDALRGAGNFRSRAWVTPTSGKILIPANDSYEYQVEMLPGSIIWAWTFAFGSDLATGFSFSVRDACNDVAFGSEVLSVNVSQASNSQYFAGVNPGQGLQNPLSKPLVVGPPGLLNVVICNLNDTDASNTQLILWGGEPFKEGRC